ncbi:MAG: hypothetical protein K0Q59_4646 [Paenibacillus sp.]|nr:hypothetical protein [Paenibacillus sp.]
MNAADFISILAPMAVKDQRSTGVLASITIAQAALESAWGAVAPGNNLFGIKGKGQEAVTQEYQNGEFVIIMDGFRVYSSWAESVADHSRFLIENGRYTAVGFFGYCASLDYVGAANALQKAGYATDPAYASKLISIIESYQLNRFDLQGATAEQYVSENDANMALQLEQWQWKMLGDALDGVYNKGLLSDWIWAEKAYTGELTETEQSWLTTVILARMNGVTI